MTGPDALTAFVARSLDREAPPEIGRLVQEIARRPGVAAILFYGNRLRDPGAGGLADLYVLTDSDRAWSGPGLAALGCRLLPPNVYHLAPPPPASPSAIPAKAGISPSSARHPRFNGNDALETDGHGGPASAGAKVAVMRLSAFRQRMRRESRDTTLWARFAQPVALLHARDDAARAAVVAAVAEAWRTAAWWADRLADAGDRWGTLFAATYAAELRPDRKGRPVAIAAAAPAFYAEIDRLLPRQRCLPAEIAEARRAWAGRCRIGRALNAARLVKAAFTFRGGTAYALDKIERHAGPAALRPWERRLPWLAAPLVLLRLLRRGGLR